jgi:PAS domain S-box-containing protein
MADLNSTVSSSALRRAIDSLTTHAVLTLDGSGTITSWNTGAERLFGHPCEQALGQNVSLILTPEDRESGIAVRRLKDAERHGPVSGNRWVVHLDGTLRYVNATIAAFRDDAGAPGYAALVHELPIAATDDDQRRMGDVLAARIEDTSQRLSESNARLTTEIAQRTHAEAGRLRLLRRLIMAEEEERRRLARDLHDDLGQRLTALRLTLEALDTGLAGRPDSSRTIRTALEMLAQIDQGLDFLAWELRPAALDELGLTKVLGTYVHEWSRHAGVPAVFHSRIPDAERFAPEVESSVYRIAQEALNNVAKHARARSVNVRLEPRGENVVLVIEDDGAGAGVGTSGSGERMIGLTGMRERAAAVDGTLELATTPGGGTTVRAEIPVSTPARIGRAAGTAFDDGGTIALPAGPAPAAPGDPGDTVQDFIRGRLHELQHAVAARDEFIATVAHELRNPVAPLMFQVRLAIDKSEHSASAGEPVPAAWVQSQLRRIEQRLHRLLETLDRLLDVSRLSTGRIDLQPEPVNLAPAVREVISSFEAELAVARCQLTFSERREATGWWDRLRLEQICRNLLSNAIRFGAGRPIDVVVDADDDFATLLVRDHGIGIAPELHARIFERFERGVEQRSGGFGIGLWVVKTICTAMGGTISVQSEVGEGACFTVKLPRRDERDAASGGTESTVGV